MKVLRRYWGSDLRRKRRENSKVGFHGMGGRNDVSHRSVGLMVFEVNISLERMYRSVIMAARRAGFC